MKGLKQFLHFASHEFFEGKELTVVGIGPLTEYSTGAVIGTKVEVAITRDDTPYNSSKDGTILTNIYERLVVKVKGATSVDAAVGDVVALVNPVGVVYGDYGNKLSVTADAVKVVNKTAKG